MQVAKITILIQIIIHTATFDDEMRFCFPNFPKFIPVVENHLGEGEEAFLTDYPKNILLSKDLKLVPWMVGLTSSDGALWKAFIPDFFQAGETKLLHQECQISAILERQWLLSLEGHVILTVLNNSN